MQLEAFPTWGTSLRQVRTSLVAACGKFVGIAIGPDSDEGAVRVNGALLEAGSILPLAEAAYTIERVNGAVGGLPSIKSLQVMLFESHSEFVDVRRPAGRYSATGALVMDGTYYEKLVVPFTGRRQLAVLLSISSVDYVAPMYQLRARRYNGGEQDIEEVIIAADQAYTVVSGGTAMAFYVGGTDSAECFDEIAIDLKATSGSGTYFVDARAIGAIGKD